MALHSIILIRHGESLEDIDPAIHNIPSSTKVSLTPLGLNQVQELGFKLQSQFISNPNLYIYVSPAPRALESWEVISKKIGNIKDIVIENRIRNLNWGNITQETRERIEKERYKAGVLNYIFPGGENTPEYVVKIEEFVSEIIQKSYKNSNQNSQDIIVIVTHGFALRIILKYLLELSNEEFETLRNPPNCYCAQVFFSLLSKKFWVNEELLRVDRTTFTDL